MNALLNYPGAKWGMAKEIVALMPPHRSYLEPFFGSGAVLFNKPPSAIETINDIDGDIVNFFKVVREQPEELAKLISLTPYARDVFDDAHENRGTEPLDRAYRFAIRSKMGHGFKTYQKTGFKIDVYARERSYCVNCWNGLPDSILEAARRLKGIQKEICKALRGQVNLPHLAEEVADATIMLEQIRLIFDINDEVCDMMDAKVERLRQRIQEHKNFPDGDTQKT